MDIEADNGATPPATNSRQSGQEKEEDVRQPLNQEGVRIYEDTTYESTNLKKSFLTQVSEAREQSSGCLSFLSLLGVAILGTCGVGCFLLLAIAIMLLYMLPVIMVVLGALNIGKCHAANIPLLLIIGGSIALVHSTFESVWRRPNTKQGEAEPSKPLVLRMALNLTQLLHLVWFIVASIVVFKAYEPNYLESSSEVYCNKTVYLFAFWYLIAGYLTIGAAVIFFCCTLLFVCYGMATFKL